MIVRWPGHIAAATTSEWVGGFQDVLPTLAELAGADAKVPGGLDGISFVPTLLAEGTQADHEYLYWAFYEQDGARALRRGNWKAVQQPLASRLRLYDLAQDLGEDHDLGADHPQVARELERLMDEAYVPSARWQFPVSEPDRTR
jgi:arylsulfatase A-like enzyme